MGGGRKMECRRVIRIVALLMVAIGLTVLSSCGNVEPHPSDYEQLSGLIGQPMESVFAALALPQNMQATNPGTYKLPQKAEYAGVEFDVYLTFDAGYGDKLFRIKYQAIYQDNTRQAAEDGLKVAKNLSKAYGKTYVREEPVIADMSKNELIADLAGDEVFKENNFWDISQSCGENVKAFMEEIGSSEQWKQTSAYQKLGWLPCYYLDCDVISVPESGTQVVQIEYVVECYRGDGNWTETESGVVS